MVSEEIKAALLQTWHEAEAEGNEGVYANLGMLDPSQAGLAAQDFQSQVAAGVAWFDAQAVWVRGNLCKTEVVKELSKATATDLLVPIFGMLQTKFGQALALYATIIVIRKLLEGFCRGVVEPG